jgi:Ran GTPase-activating protein (RanGAP) involved in mRNA processing and transport
MLGKSVTSVDIGFITIESDTHAARICRCLADAFALRYVDIACVDLREAGAREICLLVEAGSWDSLVSLRLASNSFESQAIGEIIGAVYQRRDTMKLEVLDVSANPSYHEDNQHVYDILGLLVRDMVQLRCLNLAGCAFEDKLAGAVEQVTCRSQLVQIVLDENPLSSRAFVSVCKSLGKLPRLEHLSISRCVEIDSQSLIAITELLGESKLMYKFELSDCPFMDVSNQELFNLAVIIGRHPSLEYIDISACLQSRAVFKHLLNSIPENDNLKTINFGETDKRALDIDALCSLIRSCKNLSCLLQNGIQLNPQVSKIFQASLYNRSLRILEMVQCHLTDRDIMVLSDSLLALTAITDLDLSMNQITNLGCEHLSKFLNGSKLETLDLSFNKDITEIGLEFLASGFGKNASIIELKLSKVSIKHVNFFEIFSEKLASVEYVDFSYNLLDKSSVDSLYNLFEVKPPALYTLKLQGNNFDKEDYIKILSSCMNSEFLQSPPLDYQEFKCDLARDASKSIENACLFNKKRFVLNCRLILFSWIQRRFHGSQLNEMNNISEVFDMARITYPFPDF